MTFILLRFWSCVDRRPILSAPLVHSVFCPLSSQLQQHNVPTEQCHEIEVSLQYPTLGVSSVFCFFWKGGFEFQWKSGEEFLNLECFREAAMTWIIRGKNVAFCTPHKSMWKTKANIPKRNDICSIVKDCKHVFWACSEIWAVTGVYVVDLKVLRSNRLGHEVIAGMNNQYIFSPGVIPLFACTTV